MNGAEFSLKSWKVVFHSWGHWLHAVYVAMLIAGYAISDALGAREAKVLIAYIGLFVYVLMLVGLLIYVLYRRDRELEYEAAHTLP
jgi:hypothetical protein